MTINPPPTPGIDFINVADQCVPGLNCNGLAQARNTLDIIEMLVKNLRRQLDDLEANPNAGDSANTN